MNCKYCKEVSFVILWFLSWGCMAAYLWFVYISNYYNYAKILYLLLALILTAITFLVPIYAIYMYYLFTKTKYINTSDL